MKKNKVLVTGAAGFLGSHLAEKLANMGDSVVGVDNMKGGYADNVPKNIKFHEMDCCDLQKMNEVMTGVEVVYHCAATAHEGLSVFSPQEITKNISIPTIGIGASKYCDGQVLVTDDVLGLTDSKIRFVKKFTDINYKSSSTEMETPN